MLQEYDKDTGGDKAAAGAKGNGPNRVLLPPVAPVADTKAERNNKPRDYVGDVVSRRNMAKAR